MDKHGFTWNVMKFVRFHACGFDGCMQRELDSIRGKLNRLNLSET